MAAPKVRVRASRDLQVRELDRAEHPAWVGMVAESPDGSIYALPAYLNALCAATGGQFRILAAMRDDEILGGVALFGHSSRFGVQVQPRLLLHYNGLVLRADAGKYPSRRDAHQLATLTALEAALRRDHFGRLALKSRHTFHDARVFLANGWQARPSYSYVVPLDDLDALWDRMEQNLRRLVRRAESEGLEMTEDDDFTSFHRLHWNTRSRKAAPVYLAQPGFAAWFRTLHALGLCRLYHARLDGRSIATQLVLTGPHPVSHTVVAGGDARHLHTGCNAFLRWRVFQDLARRGVQANDLTDASINPVTRFKSQLGGDLRMSITVSRPDAFGLRLRNALVQAPVLARGLAAIRGRKVHA